MTSSPPDPENFPVTDWYLVRAAGMADPASLEKLCRNYWKPLFLYARRRGLTSEDAEDATQSYFEKFMDLQVLQTATESRGRLRSFLMKTFIRHMADDRRTKKAIKRGGKTVTISFDATQLDQTLAAEAHEHLSAEDFFEVMMAKTYLEQAMWDVKSQYEAKDGGPEFELLRPHLAKRPRKGTVASEEADLVTQGELAEKMSISVESVRTKLLRMRRCFAERFRERVRQSLTQPTEANVSEEIAEILLLLQKAG